MQTSQVRAQQSVTSLARYAPPRVNGVDPFHGYENRDFCNSFWGSGESGPNVLFARMRGAERSTDELRNFWQERTTIEEEYAQKLAKLSKVPIGVEEVGELRVSLNILRKETEAQAQSHLELADRMRNVLEKQTAEFHMKQINHRRAFQASMEKKLKNRQTQESFAQKAREKYEIDRGRINSFLQQLTYMTGTDKSRVEAKLARTRETAKANEKDFAAFTQTVVELLEEWQTEWKTFCDSCHDLEEERMEFMKDNLWMYANEVSTLCVSDDQSCERIREALDQFEPERDVLNFAEEYGSGNELPQPPSLLSDPNDPSSAPKSQFADFQRKSERVPRPYPVDADGYGSGEPGSSAAASQPNGIPDTNIMPRIPEPANPPPQPPTGAPPVTGTQGTMPVPPISSPGMAAPVSPPSTSSPTTRNSRPRQSSMPLPGTPGNMNGVNGPERTGGGVDSNRILFYVEAMYDYKATIDEEFDFQAGDIIAVTAAPEDGWWSGELLDEARRVEGKNIFPMNFTRLF